MTAGYGCSKSTGRVQESADNGDKSPFLGCGREVGAVRQVPCALKPTQTIAGPLKCHLKHSFKVGITHCGPIDVDAELKDASGTKHDKTHTNTSKPLFCTSRGHQEERLLCAAE